MPSQAYYLTDDQREYVRTVQKNRDLENASQAIQAIVDDHQSGDE